MNNYLKTGQVARLLGVCPHTVQNMAAKGELPAYRIGTQYRFNPTDVSDYLKAGFTGQTKVRDNLTAYLGVL